MSHRLTEHLEKVESMDKIIEASDKQFQKIEREIIAEIKSSSEELAFSISSESTKKALKVN